MAESTNTVFGNKQLKSKNQTKKVLASLSLGTIVNFLVFLLVGLVLLGLFVFKENTAVKVEAAQKRVENLQAQRDIDLENLVRNGLNQQAAAEELLKGHRKTSLVLDFFEQATLPQVSFEAITLDAVKNIVSLRGNAAKYSILAQQIASLKIDPGVDDVSITRATLSTEQGVDFDMQVSLNPALTLPRAANESDKQLSE